MKRILLALLIVGFAADAQAISRYTSTGMSCDKVQATIREEGAAIMRYTSKRVAGLPLYGRYVSDRQFCQSNETTEYATIRAADTDVCPVLQCKEIEFEFPSDR